MSAARLAELGIRVPDRPGEHRAPCPRCDRGSRDDALAARLEPAGSATWYCHRCGWSGGLLPEGRPLHRPSWSRQSTRGRSDQPERHDVLAPDAEASWRACRPIEPGTVAAAYLEQRECALPHPEGDLRFLPDHRHPGGFVGPALVALVTDAETGVPLTLHRTWLSRDGTGKASVDRPRLLLKGHRKAGGVVRLWPDAEITTGLAIAEGVETALAAARGFRPVWAMIDAGNLGAFPVLAGVEALTIVADHDPAGLKAADACARRWVASDREVRIWTAPKHGQDFADFAVERSAA